MSDDDRGIILCMRTTHEPVATSTKVPGNCGHELWAADSSILFAHQVAEEKGVIVEYTCVPCALINDIKGKPPEEIFEALTQVLHEDEINEIREAFK